MAQVARVGDRGRERATYGARPCNLKARLTACFGKEPTCQKDHAQQDVNAVVGLAEIQHARDVPQAIRWLSQGHSQNTEREINHAEDKREDLRSGQSSSEAEI